jgi:hypothetical protein
MRGKPDTSAFQQPKKDPTEFLEGGEADRAEKGAPSRAVVAPPVLSAPVDAAAPIGRVQKIFNFPVGLAGRLRDEAMRLSREKGTRVTEKDLVVAALEAFLAR